MKNIVEKHFESIFEMSFLLIIFIAGALLLARFPDNEQLASWVTGGAVIGVLARALGSNDKKKDGQS